ncbi:hypothetical protein Q5P01_000755 [Channa striata]|uniref:Uncharacterized protein n=1 Tax=Channa striata TaxID=64152 RepID=A0AA88IIQ1_CHASR|nr:hypothetical protein Q5P01_000755 [Channa striata]
MDTSHWEPELSMKEEWEHWLDRIIEYMVTSQEDRRLASLSLCWSSDSGSRRRIRFYCYRGRLWGRHGPSLALLLLLQVLATGRI